MSIWALNSDTNMWYRSSEGLSVSSFNSYLQNIESIIYYSKCCSGSTYIPLNNFDNIYDVLSYPSKESWYVGTLGSPYSVSPLPDNNPMQITATSSEEYYDKFLPEYGLTLKNQFSATKTIQESIQNFIQVDVATTTAISNISQPTNNIIIDGITLIPGQLVLVKDQITYVTLSISIDPATYFTCNYYISQVTSTFIIYYYYNNQNGVYQYVINATGSGYLQLTNNLTNYEGAMQFSVYVKLGTINTQTQWHLSRLLDGYYPLISDGSPIEFDSKHNWVLRNVVEYDNLFEENYNGIITHGTQSYYNNYDSFTYTIPPRTIAVGDFGVIINNQGPTNSISNVIENKYKNNINSICETSGFYWICGDSGILLNVYKVDFAITQAFGISPINNLNDVSFLNDINGVVVGSYNTIYTTQDGGNTWVNLYYPEFEQYSYTRVIYYSNSTIYISGQNGLFIELTLSNNIWTAYKRLISMYLTPTDDYVLVENINDMTYANFTAWGLTWSGVSLGTISTTASVLLMVTDNNNFIVYDINGFIPNYQYDFLYLGLSPSFGNMNAVIAETGTTNVFFNSETFGMYSFDMNDFLTIGTTSNYLTSSITPTLISSTVSNVNRFCQYNNELFIAGNDGLLYTNYFISGSFSELDPTFTDRLFPKLLFLDYDIASKVYFYDSNGNYTLPNSLTFSTLNFGTISSIDLSNLPNENNWINYYADAEKTFKYYTSISTGTEVEFSTNFTWLNSSTGSTSGVSFTSSQITNNYYDILPLAPNFGSQISSRFIAGTTSISGSTSSASLFIYKYLMIIEYNSAPPISIGDVMYMTSSVVNSTFVVNNIINISSNYYIYMYTDFNDDIITNLKNTTESINFTNLQLYENGGELVYKFGLHPLSYGYDLEFDTTGSIIELSAVYDNKTAYYNMETDVIIGTSSGSATYSMTYPSGFIDFGYKPTYNILDYLSFINPNIFTASKQFLALPMYQNMPGNNGGGFTYSNIYIDTNYPTNQLLFGNDLEFEWNSIFINTFVDLTLNGTYSSTLLIMNKYTDPVTGGFVLEFQTNINIPLYSNIYSIDILSRNSLQQISDDLQVLNNIQRSSSTRVIQTGYPITNLQNELNFKIPTDSYAKALLSDADIKQQLSGMIYVDSINELSLNMINLTKDFNIPISHTYNYGGLLQINCGAPHGLTNSEGAVLTFNGGTGSSEQFNPQYFGYYPVTIIDDYNFYVPIPFSVTSSVNDTGNVYYVNEDPFLDFEPIDLLDLGIDLNTKIAVAIDPPNWTITGSTYSLININTSNYRYTLVDGLDIDTINSQYSWILEAEISNAIIGQDSNGLVWYTGTWSCGRWYGGTWYNGTWINGTWYEGIWNSVGINNQVISVKTGLQENDQCSTWYNGTWMDGYWNGGTWYNGNWYGGTWSTGTWFNGTWNEGTWFNGTFNGGVWIQGLWQTGTFSCENTSAYWLDGVWNGGDFENGMWLDGTFGGTSSTFGSGAFNTRTATWQGGNWLNGSFFSSEDFDSNGNPEVSLVHKYSIWMTGQWNAGNWYGGIAYNIDFRSGNWFGGILDDIEIIGVSILNNQITLNGSFYFNINDQIWIIDNNTGGTYSLIGSNSYPKNYMIAETIQNTNATTTLVLNYGLSSLGSFAPMTASNIDTGLRIVSKFTNSNWNSGIWTNGIFDGANGNFSGGIWYNGVFLNGTWGS